MPVRIIHPTRKRETCLEKKKFNNGLGGVLPLLSPSTFTIQNMHGSMVHPQARGCATGLWKWHTQVGFMHTAARKRHGV